MDSRETPSHQEGYKTSATPRFRLCTIRGCYEILFQEGRCLDHWLEYDRTRTCAQGKCDRRPDEESDYCKQHQRPCENRKCSHRVPATKLYCSSCLKRQKKRKAPRCSFQGCKGPAESKGLCSAHRQQQKLGQELKPIRKLKTCAFKECTRKTYFKHCSQHRRQIRLGQELHELRTTRDGCCYPQCDRPHHAKGYCSGHYTQLRTGKELSPLKGIRKVYCSFPECKKPEKVRGLCNGHDHQRRAGKELTPLRQSYNELCSFEGCDRPHYSKGLCSGHYNQQQRGQQLRPLEVYVERTCMLDGCSEPYHCQDLCKRHYRVWQKIEARLLQGTEPSWTDNQILVYEHMRQRREDLAPLIRTDGKHKIGKAS